MLRPWRERLAGPLPVHAGKGSFDCVSLHFVNGNFAQDDIGLMDMGLLNA
jgi:hypothetical protein